MGMKVNGSTGLTFPDSTTMVTGNQAVKAWVNFNGTGTVAIRASYNVTSITDVGTGYYTANFTTAMPDVNFTMAGSSGSQIGGGADNGVVTNVNRTTSAVSFLTRNVQSSGSTADYDTVQVAIFR